MYRVGHSVGGAFGSEVVFIYGYRVIGTLVGIDARAELIESETYRINAVQSHRYVEFQPVIGVHSQFYIVYGDEFRHHSETEHIENSSYDGIAQFQRNFTGIVDDLQSYAVRVFDSRAGRNDFVRQIRRAQSRGKNIP